MKTAFQICSRASLSGDPKTESVGSWEEDPSVLLRTRVWVPPLAYQLVLPSEMSYHLQALPFLRQIIFPRSSLDALTCSGG